MGRIELLGKIFGVQEKHIFKVNVNFVSTEFFLLTKSHPKSCQLHGEGGKGAKPPRGRGICE